MRTIAITLVVVVIVVAGACLVIPNFRGHLSQVPIKLGNKVDEASSTRELVNIHRANIDRELGKLRESYQGVYRAKVETQQLTAKRDAFKIQLAREERICDRGQELLEKTKPGESVIVGGVRYTWEQVNEDVLTRVAACQDLRTKIQDNEGNLRDLEKAYEDGRTAIVQAEVALQKERSGLAVLEVNINLMEERERVKTLIASIPKTGEYSSKLAPSRQALEERANKLVSGREFDTMVSAGRTTQMTGSWLKETGEKEPTAVEAYKAYKEAKAAPQPTPAAIPDLGRALEVMTTAPAVSR